MSAQPARRLNREPLGGSKMIDKYYSSLEQISLPIQSWSVSLIGINHDQAGNQLMSLCGSGTLIKINSIFGILTANHVLELLQENYESLGLLLIEGRHCFNQPLQYFTLEKIAVPIIEDEGPDLGFIRTPIEIAREIMPYKGFFDLSSDREFLLNQPPVLNDGIWYVSGTPDEYTSRDISAKRPAIKLRPFCWVCEAIRIYKKEAYDYIETEVYYNQGEKLPSSFGGISGGGLWQVLVEKKSEEELISKRYLFSGVVFYQSSISDDRRVIKCHGRESIYTKLFEYINS